MGGAGRYLILHLPTRRQFAVFDANAADVVKYLPAEGQNVRFAAGRDRLMVVLNNAVLQRWNLGTFEFEQSAALPFKGVVKTVAMGAASAGPLLVHWARGTEALDQASWEFFDPQTLRRLPTERFPMSFATSYRDFAHVRASGDGRLFGMWCTSHSPTGLQTLVLEGREVKHFYDHDSVGHVIPGPDGRVVFTGMGLHTREGRVLALGGRRRFYCLPARHGVYYLATQTADGKSRLAVYLPGHSQPVCDLPDAEVMTRTEAEVGAKTDFLQDKRIHWLPDAKLLVTIPPGDGRLLVRRFDVGEELSRSGLDYLLVTSQAPESARRGANYVYQLHVKSKHDVRYRVEYGPAGARIDRAGRLTWAVPAGFDGRECTVVVGVRSASGKECFHRFTLRITR
jgi:hypothetical protein